MGLAGVSTCECGEEILRRLLAEIWSRRWGVPACGVRLGWVGGWGICMRVEVRCMGRFGVEVSGGGVRAG